MNWIKCSERLPNAKELPVLVYFRYGTLGFMKASGDIDHFNDWGITHWMLLPEYPKEGD